MVSWVGGDVQRIAELVDSAWCFLKLVKTRFDFVDRVVDLRRNTCGYFAVEEVVLVPVLVTGTSPVTAIYVCRFNRRASIFVGDGNSVRGCDLGAVFRFNGRNVCTNRGRRVCEVQWLPRFHLDVDVAVNTVTSSCSVAGNFLATRSDLDRGNIIRQLGARETLPRRRIDKDVVSIFAVFRQVQGVLARWKPHILKDACLDDVPLARGFVFNG